MAPSASGPSVATSLAPELLHIIFAPLPQPAILAAAAVCSLWRACAIVHPMYYRPWAFVFPTSMLPMLGYSLENADIQQLEDVASESEADGYNLGLSVFVHLEQLPPDGGATDDIDIAAPWADNASSIEASAVILEHALVPILRRAVARCIVLNVSCDALSFDLVSKGLSRPAPLLRSLKISVENNDTHYSVVDREPLPAGFLSAEAPRLTEVSLFGTAVSEASPCFPSVNTLLLYCPLSLAAAHAAFPGTRHLTIRRLADDYEVSDRDHAIFHGLDALLIGPKDVDALEEVPALHKNAQIPLIEYTGDRLNEFDDILPAEGDVSVHIFEHVRRDWDHDVSLDVPPRFGQLCLEFRAGGVVRRVDSDVPFLDACEFLGFGPALSYITNLTIDDRHLRTFMETWECFPSLRNLRLTLISWARPAPGVRLTPHEEIIYSTDHVRSQCGCLGGLFSDYYDGSCPDGDVHMELISLETLELIATRAHAAVPVPILRALSRSFGRRMHLVLSNGLAVSEDAARPLFASITSLDAAFCPDLPFVARAAALLEAAASERKDALQSIDHALRKYGADFHWDHCHEPSPVSKEDPRLAVM